MRMTPMPTASMRAESSSASRMPGAPEAEMTLMSNSRECTSSRWMASPSAPMEPSSLPVSFIILPSCISSTRRLLCASFSNSLRSVSPRAACIFCSRYHQPKLTSRRVAKLVEKQWKLLAACCAACSSRVLPMPDSPSMMTSREGCWDPEDWDWDWRLALEQEERDDSRAEMRTEEEEEGEDSSTPLARLPPLARPSLLPPPPPRQAPKNELSIPMPLPSLLPSPLPPLFVNIPLTSDSLPPFLF
mmetsp:Transcript_35415/g.87009  ORF Transcript_35415/g.87009 Transcript_35415/m.87009 type:complete len:245 (-) Transcript_35415:767-1501(-)